MSLEAMFNRVVDIKRPLITRADSGASIAEWIILSRSVPCRIHPLSQREAMSVQGHEGVVATHRMLTEYSGEIKNSDEVWEGATRYRVMTVDRRRAMDDSIRHTQLDLLLLT